MTSQEFAMILQGAVAGRHEDLEKIFELYMPLINKHSIRNGQLDEDLRQYIMIHIALKISKFMS